MYTSKEYLPLKPKEYQEESSDDTDSYRNAKHKQSQSSRFRMRVLWIVFGSSLLVNAFILVRDIRVIATSGVQKDTFQAGFQTDFKPALSAIKTHKVLFEGSPRFYPNGTMYSPKPHNGPRYIGEPSQEIDDNWHALTKGRYWVLSEDEAIQAFGAEEYHAYWDPSTKSYIAGFDAQHTLHCLNFLRMSFYPDYYTDKSPIHGIVHRDHCIDHLRQLVQCQGDITPIPTRFREGIGRNYIDSNRWHTCRDWTSIRQWVDQRYAESKKVVAEHTNGEVDFVT
ncbi:hypothetical protein BGZ60DRAFT_554929 [Tricladium varicosporioides]|nr:hypothetical protein BGZ60DRAFT_554929 [Hymenoscyphus varicosporioides]